MRTISISLIFILSFVFMGLSFFKGEEVKVPKEEQIVNSLIGRVAEVLKQRYEIRPVGTFVSMPRCIVKKLGLRFQIRGPLERSELRKILVDIAKDFVSMVNEDSDLTPLLETSPFTVKNVDVSFFTVDKTGRDLWAPYISIASLRNGILEYLIIEKKDGTYPIKDEFIESYDEALKAL